MIVTCINVFLAGCVKSLEPEMTELQLMFHAPAPESLITLPAPLLPSNQFQIRLFKVALKQKRTH